MSQIESLNRVIRRVESSDPLLDESRGEQLVVIDARRRRERVLDRAPFWTLGRDVRYYVVSSVGSASCDGPRLILSDLATERRIEVSIRYVVQSAPGRARRLALELGTHDDLQRHLDGLIQTWAEEFLQVHRRGGEDVIGGFFRVKPSLERHLSERALGIGLELDAIVEIEGEAELKPIEIEIERLPVKLQDDDGEVAVRLKAELGVAPKHRVEAVLRRDDLEQLEPKLTERVRSFMLEQVTAHDFHFNLKDGVRSRLKAFLDEVVAEDGRAVAHLVLEPVEVTDVEKDRTLEYSVPCRIKDPSTEVVLQNSLLLSLQDLGKWRLAGFSSLESWCERVLEPIVREHLFDLSYLDLLIQFAETEETIKERVRRAASDVGYSVHHHVVLPNLPPLDLPQGFDLDFTNEFSTLDSRIKVGLRVVVHGRIPDLRKIEHLLRPGVDLVEKMQSRAERVTQRVIHGIHPERFYMRFQFTDVPGEQPVEEEVRAAIQEELETTFAVEDPDVVLKLTETPLTTRVADLCKGHHMVEFRCRPLRGGGAGEPVPFVVYFEVLGVQNWFTFHSKGYESTEREVDAIRQILAETLRGDLETVPQQELQYRDIEGRVVVSRHIFTRAIERVNEVFGLEVRIITMRRKPTAQESALQSVNEGYAEQYKKAELANLTRKLEYRQTAYTRLVEKLDKLRKDHLDPDDPEILTLRKQIAELEEELTQKAPDFGKKLITEAADGSSRDVNWDAYSEQPSLIGPETRARLDRGAEGGDE